MPKPKKLMKRRIFLLGIGSLATTAAIAKADKFSALKNYQKWQDSKERDFTVVGNRSLRDRAAARNLIYGAASDYRYLSVDAKLAAVFAQECGIIVPENDMKWTTLRPTPDSFNFVQSDWLAEFAQEHKMLLRGHTLVWHEALPTWFKNTVNRQNALPILLKHIETVAGRYAGKIHSWDVVNEVVLPKDGRSDGLRNTPWLQFLGPDYIDIAFRAAAKADPRALLVYNDYGLDYDTYENEAKRVAVLKLLERLKSKGTPIHAFGMQAHLAGEETRFNPKKLKDFLQDVASLGLKILITEMDVTDQKLPVDADIRDRIIAGVYEDYLSAVLEEPAVIAVLTWGLSDRYTWLSEFKPRNDKAAVRSMPLDVNLKRKLAWNAIARALDSF
ncbi:MAG TPA: glycosyl hydrolase family 10 [Cyanobacteria bacterium UBA8553]|nr:glycosyl hydrolase family 10 [Cyanobacteria bacterium UBA8553]